MVFDIRLVAEVGVQGRRVSVYPGAREAGSVPSGQNPNIPTIPPRRHPAPGLLRILDYPGRAHWSRRRCQVRLEDKSSYRARARNVSWSRTPNSFRCAAEKPRPAAFDFKYLPVSSHERGSLHWTSNRPREGVKSG